MLANPIDPLLEPEFKPKGVEDLTTKTRKWSTPQILIRSRI